MSLFDEPDEERARRYLQLAESARRQAERTATKPLKESYEQLAAGWETLALGIEHRLNESLARAPVRPLAAVKFGH
jgi:hypothetical protein